MKREMKLLAISLCMCLLVIGIAYAFTRLYHMRATVGGVALGVYLDSTFTTPLRETETYDWETVYSGDKKPIWIRNEGTQAAIVHLECVDAVGCSIAFSVNDITLYPSTFHRVDLTITILDPEAVGSTIYWYIDISTTP